MSDLISRDALLGAAVRRFAEVDIDGLGRARIRSLTELERSRIEASMRDKKGQLSSSRMVDLKCRLIVDAVVDAESNPLFTNSDIERIRQQDSKVTNALVEAIQAHCGWSDSDLEELEKN
jgi:hypothetical protein